MLRPELKLALLPLLAAALGTGCLFGGGSSPTVSALRPGAVPTATMPANLPDPIMLGQSQAAGGPATSATGGADTYVIKSGDTLYQVAANLGVPDAQRAQWVADVIKLNSIQDTTTLYVGQEIRVPRLQATPTATGTAAAKTPTTVSASATTIATSTPATTATPRPTSVPASGSTYTVQSGDTPYSIAQSLGVPQSQWASWSAELLSLNGATASGLQVGMVLKLPASTPSGGSGTAATATPTR